MTPTPTQVLKAAIEEDVRNGRLLEVAIVAKRLKRSPETIRMYIRRGRLLTCRAGGGHYLVPESALMAFLTTPRNTHKHNISPSRSA